MSWKMNGDPKTRKLTKGLATEFAEMQPAPHDRPLNSTRCAVLKSAFDLGKFRTCEWAKAYCTQTKQWYRVNGKHTSTVLASSNGEFPKDLCVIVEEYECDTLEDVASLYATFDTRSQTRSTGDIYHVFASSCPELNEIGSRIVTLTVGAIAFALWEDAHLHKPVEERGKLILTNAPFCLWLADLMQGEGVNNQKLTIIRRVPVAAAMYKTWLKSKQAATEFWTAVRDETGTKPDMPDRKLAKFLSIARLHTRGTCGKPAGNREVLVKCLHAWNAYRSGELTNLNYFAKAKTPAVK